MRYALYVSLALLLVSGCAGTVTKSFKVISDPPDAEIKVISGKERAESKYSSPADITIVAPKEPSVAAKDVLEITKDDHKPKTFAIRNIRDGETISVKLDKIIRHSLKHRMLSPVKSDEFSFRDKIISISFLIEEKAFQMNIENLTSYTLKILWDQSEYSDYSGRRHRLMHAGVKYQDRNNPIPAQILPPRGAIQQAVMPVNSVAYSQEKRAYELKLLFPTDNEAAPELRGRTYYLFIPIELDRQIIPYQFRFEIADVERK